MCRGPVKIVRTKKKETQLCVQLHCGGVFDAAAG